MREQAKRALKSAAAQFHEKTGTDLLNVARAATTTRSAPSGAIKAPQISLMLHYRELAARAPELLPDLVDTEVRWYSQNGEDGILLYLLSLTGMPTRKAVEIGAGDGVENNLANLILHHSFEALLCEGDEDRAAYAREFYRRSKDTRYWPPSVATDWISSDNINSVLEREGFTGEIDVLSIDIDGVDYWVWEAISAVSPRVVVAEYNNLWEAGAAMTIPNDPTFVANFEEGNPIEFYGGASLEALDLLGRKKGYRLVGVQHYCWNAFFVRNDVATDLLPEVAVADCLDHPLARHAIDKRQPKVRNLPWVDVTADVISPATI